MQKLKKKYPPIPRELCFSLANNDLLFLQTLTVTGKKSFENIPDVPGLLSYRTDNKQLYVNEGTKWEPLGKDEEV